MASVLEIYQDVIHTDDSCLICNFVERGVEI